MRYSCVVAAGERKMMSQPFYLDTRFVMIGGALGILLLVAIVAGVVYLVSARRGKGRTGE